MGTERDEEPSSDRAVQLTWAGLGEAGPAVELRPSTGAPVQGVSLDAPLAEQRAQPTGHTAAAPQAPA